MRLKAGMGINFIQFYILRKISNQISKLQYIIKLF